MAAKSAFDEVQFPEFSTLPFRDGDPEGAIWGFYEYISHAPPSFRDELGSLNLLTPARILKASQHEIQLGKVISLNWALQKPFPAGYQRKSFQHRVFKWPGRFIIDDEIQMNTQCGSQWDGLRHWGYYKTGQFYNGLPLNEIVDENGQGIETSVDKPLRNGVHKFQGKIVGRGVLLDYLSYAEKSGITFAANEQHVVTAADLDACAAAQETSFEQGDILFVRMGYILWYENANEEERIATLTAATKSVGLNQGQEEVEWLWNHHFSAVASDTPAFEVRPSMKEWDLHDYLLAMWGTPMGELFDLEELAKICKTLGRYSFFVTSSPLNIVNGIASPPK
ncbi:putative cyclase-domain-containing protein [Crucibulum laeve]|uniref:Putative cyclase-domain-containing protein n=1 Tax=Crucibulum laeve TaxID=68775 RepID=A0A5C3MFK5_9AGAR|nr:putative cyclase-domain-containing protein [Crucibulum laeve]